MDLNRKYYLIDTEKVGDRWFGLLQKVKKKDRIIFFYTKYHSKHLEECLIKQVHNPRMVWLECAAGNNALDYQLMGVLAYLIAKYPESLFYIYSNDKDYQTAIDFWQSRGIKELYINNLCKMRRIFLRECQLKIRHIAGYVTDF